MTQQNAGIKRIRGPHILGQQPTPRRLVIILTLLVLYGSQALPQESSGGRGHSQVSGLAGTTTVTTHQLLAPASARRAIEKAQRALSKGKAIEEERYVDEALAAYPHFAIALTMRALLRVDKGKTAEAAADLVDAIAADPVYGPPYIVLGAIYNQMGRYDDAIQILTQGLSILPKAWQVHVQLGLAYFGKRNDSMALREITAGIELQSQHVRSEDRALAHFYLASVLVQLNDLSRAASECETVIKEAPESELAGMALALVRSMSEPELSSRN